MSFAQNSLVTINVLVVDDDPVFLSIVPHLLKNSQYRVESIMEMRVTCARSATEALSIIKVQRNKIDLVITDYHMPGIDGLQLKRQITREFGNIPVIVMSSDINKDIESESLSRGALYFIPKPIRAYDVPKIWKFAMSFKKNKFAVSFKKDKFAVSFKKEERNKESGSSNSTNANAKAASVDNSSQKNKSRKRKTSESNESQASKKAKLVWTENLHHLFMMAIQHLGHKAVPKKILEFMNVSYLTRENVASHLQKYRIFLRKIAEQGLRSRALMLSGSARSKDSVFANGHINSEPYSTTSASSSSSTSTSTTAAAAAPPAYNINGVGESEYSDHINPNNSFFLQPDAHFLGFGQYEAARFNGPINFNDDIDMLNNYYGSFYHNQPGPGPTLFSSQTPFFFNNDNPQSNEREARNPQSLPNLTTHYSTFDPQLHNFNFSSDVATFKPHHGKEQEKTDSTNVEQNKMFQFEDDACWNSDNINKGRTNGETVGAFVAQDMYFPVINQGKCNKNEEPYGTDLIDWSAFQDLIDGGVMDSLLSDDMN